MPGFIFCVRSTVRSGMSICIYDVCVRTCYVLNKPTCVYTYVCMHMCMHVCVHICCVLISPHDVTYILSFFILINIYLFIYLNSSVLYTHQHALAVSIVNHLTHIDTWTLFPAASCIIILPPPFAPFGTWNVTNLHMCNVFSISHYRMCFLYNI
jgi:hypothetical protein